MQPTLSEITARVRVAIVAIFTEAHWLMVLNWAASVESTRADARVLTALLKAGTVGWAILMNDALRAAVWWSTKHSGDTGANGTIILDTTHWVRTTWARHTWIHRSRWVLSCKMIRDFLVKVMENLCYLKSVSMQASITMPSSMH